MAVRKSLNQILKNLTPIKQGDNIYQALTAERINNIQEALHLLTRGDNINSGINIRKRSGEGFVTLSAHPRGALGGGAGLDVPWEINVTVEGGSYIVRLNPGTINNVLPSNMFVPWTIDPFSLLYVSLDINTDGKQITEAEIDISTNWADPLTTTLGAAPEFFSIQLGVINNATPFNLVNELLLCSPLNVFTTLKESLSPGLPIWDLWYTWDISTY